MYPHFRWGMTENPEHRASVAPVLWPDCQGSSQARRRTAWRSQPWWKIMSPQVTSLVEVACLCWLSLQVSKSIYPDSWSLLVPPCSRVVPAVSHTMPPSSPFSTHKQDLCSTDKLGRVKMLNKDVPRGAKERHEGFLVCWVVWITQRVTVNCLWPGWATWACTARCMCPSTMGDSRLRHYFRVAVQLLSAAVTYHLLTSTSNVIFIHMIFRVFCELQSFL